MTGEFLPTSDPRPGQRPRLTREQSRRQTRERLLDAAQALFTARGMDRTSVEEVAARAGYTRGAFYSNFTDKTALIFALLQRNHDLIVTKLDEVFDDTVDAANVDDRILRFFRILCTENQCFPILMEAMLRASHDRDFQATLNAHARAMAERVAGVVARVSERIGRPLQTSPTELGIGLISLCQGIQISLGADPERVTPELAERVMAYFCRSALFGSGSPRR